MTYIRITNVGQHTTRLETLKVYKLYKSQRVPRCAIAAMDSNKHFQICPKIRSLPFLFIIPILQIL